MCKCFFSFIVSFSWVKCCLKDVAILHAVYLCLFQSGQCIQKTSTPSVIAPVDDSIFFATRGVRVGSMRTSGEEVRFMNRSIQFKVKSE